MEISQNLIALISVIVSGFVAISSIVAPIIINQISERNKWKREIKRDRLKLISELTQDFLESLSGFRSGDINSATGHRPPMAYKDLLSSYYKWECIVSENLMGYKDRVLKLRKALEDSDNAYQKFFADTPNISNEILELSLIAKKNISK
jgi:hypothetical protein